MKRFAMAASLVLLASTGVNAQTTEQLNKGGTDTSNVLNYGMGYNLQRFSTLNQINKDSIKNLVPVWNYSFNDDRSEESQPLVYQGVVYVTTHAATMAIDAKTGIRIGLLAAGELLREIVQLALNVENRRAQIIGSAANAIDCHGNLRLTGATT